MWTILNTFDCFIFFYSFWLDFTRYYYVTVILTRKMKWNESCEETLYSRKMFVVCVNSKYGLSKYAKTYVNNYFNDIYQITQGCKEIYCHYRYPFKSYLFDKFWRCKSLFFSSSSTFMNKPEKYNWKQLETLKEEVCVLKL